MYLNTVEAEVLLTTCHYCERVLKQGCRNEESFQAEVTESKGHCPVILQWLVILRWHLCVIPPTKEKCHGSEAQGGKKRYRLIFVKHKWKENIVGERHVGDPRYERLRRSMVE